MTLFMQDFTAMLSAVLTVYAAYMILVKFYEWLLKRGKLHSKKYEKEKEIDGLIREHRKNTCGAREEIRALSEVVETLVRTQNEMVDHNLRQDAKIVDSLEEREIIMDVCTAILDWQADNGGNGSTRRAKKRISDYMLKMSHRSD